MGRVAPTRCMALGEGAGQAALSALDGTDALINRHFFPDGNCQFRLARWLTDSFPDNARTRRVEREPVVIGYRDEEAHRQCTKQLGYRWMARPLS